MTGRDQPLSGPARDQPQSGPARDQPQSGPARERESDRERWNRKYSSAQDSDDPPAALVSVLDMLPTSGRALDIAGGRGTTAAVLALRGLQVTVADVSRLALDMAVRRAGQLDVSVETVEIDLRADPPPAGPWELITVFHYLDRAIFPSLIDRLVPGGLLVVGIATRTHLQRHSRPGPGFVLDDGEILTLTPGLDMVHHREEWDRTGRHEAVFVGRRPGLAAPATDPT